MAHLAIGYDWQEARTCMLLLLLKSNNNNNNMCIQSTVHVHSK